jgi:hypothetical protein
MTAQDLSIFTKYAKNLLPSNLQGKSALPLKNHPQIQLIIDILSRQHRHSLFLQMPAETFDIFKNI